MPYLVALVLVAAFTANVVFGAVGQERFVGSWHPPSAAIS
jgi:hypothetical protein